MFTLCKFISGGLTNPLKETDQHIVDALRLLCGT